MFLPFLFVWSLCQNHEVVGFNHYFLEALLKNIWALFSKYQIQSNAVYPTESNIVQEGLKFNVLLLSSSGRDISSERMNFWAWF